MQPYTTREKILQNKVELVMDRKLFMKISFDIAEMQIKKLWNIWPTHQYAPSSLSIRHQRGYTSNTVLLHTNTTENWKEFRDHQLPN